MNSTRDDKPGEDSPRARVAGWWRGSRDPEVNRRTSSRADLSLWQQAVVGIGLVVAMSAAVSLVGLAIAMLAALLF